MSSIDIAADRAIIAAATPGPWRVNHEIMEAPGCRLHYDTVVAGGKNLVRFPSAQKDDASFIAAARTRWPAALDEIERLREEVLRLKMLSDSETEDAVDQVVYESQDYVDRQRAEIERLRAARDVLALTLSEFNNKLNTARATIAEREATIGEQNAEIDSLRSLAWEMAESACERGRACDANFDTAVEIARCMRKLRSVKEATIGELRAGLENLRGAVAGVFDFGACYGSRRDFERAASAADALLAKTAPPKEGT